MVACFWDSLVRLRLVGVPDTVRDVEVPVMVIPHDVAEATASSNTVRTVFIF